MGGSVWVCATRVRLPGSKHEVVLEHKPFRIGFYDDGELVLSANRCVSLFESMQMISETY